MDYSNVDSTLFESTSDLIKSTSDSSDDSAPLDPILLENTDVGSVYQDDFATSWSLSKSLVSMTDASKIPSIIADIVKIAASDANFHYIKVSHGGKSETCGAWRIGHFMFITSNVAVLEKCLLDRQFKLMDKITDAKLALHTSQLQSSQLQLSQLQSSQMQNTLAVDNLMGRFTKSQIDIHELHQIKPSVQICGIVSAGSFYGSAFGSDMISWVVFASGNSLEATFIGNHQLDMAKFAELFVTLPLAYQQQIMKNTLANCKLIETEQHEEVYIMFKNDMCIVTSSDNIRRYCGTKYYGTAQINVPFAGSFNTVQLLESMFNMGSISSDMIAQLQPKEVGQFVVLIEFLNIQLHNP